MSSQILRFQCNVCLRECLPEQLFRPEGYLATPILCDICGVGVARYWKIQGELYKAQIAVLRDIQTDLLIQLRKAEIEIKLAEREERLKERRAAKLARQPQDDSALEVEVDNSLERSVCKVEEEALNRAKQGA